ncbi:MAG: Crp/Fnr family transcriptional regulator [Acidobacteriota bacterium]
MDTVSYREFIDTFQALRNAPEQVVERILFKAVMRPFPAGMLVYSEGDACAAIAFILSGEIRVHKAAEGGREITLYEIGRGETCILNASCVLANTSYPANAVSTEEGAMLLLPANDFRKLMDTSEKSETFCIRDYEQTAYDGYGPG